MLVSDPAPSDSARAGEDEANDASAAATNEFATGDASYREPDCENLADVATVANGYRAGQVRAATEGIARARYPMSLPFIRAQDDNMLKAWFRGVADTFEGTSSRFEVAVHEGSHVWRAKRFNGKTEIFPIREDLVVEARRLSTFHRNEILTVHVDRKADDYADVYLEGASGAQGFATLLDEYQAYAHSLASRYCTRDLLPQHTRSSARDGILTMMYYVEAYLALARERHPETYAAILGDPGYRKVILTVWDRAEFWLRKARGDRRLGISDKQIAGWVYEPSRLAEMTNVREREKGGDAGKP